MKKPKLSLIFDKKSDFVEKMDSTPIATVIPDQAIKLSELVHRFETGQRLNVRENFEPLSNFTKDQIYEESFDDAPPTDVHDVVDVIEHLEQHQQHVKDYQQRKKKKSEETQQAPQEAQQETPPDPAQ